MLIRINECCVPSLVSNNRLERSGLRRFNYLIETAFVLHSGLKGELALEVCFCIKRLEFQYIAFFLFASALGSIQMKLTANSHAQQ